MSNLLNLVIRRDNLCGFQQQLQTAARQGHYSSISGQHRPSDSLLYGKVADTDCFRPSGLIDFLQSRPCLGEMVVIGHF